MFSASRKIIHIDMDCFFAAVEMRDDPKLRELPIAVGGQPHQRGVISTCNYIARDYGVHSAMSSAYAKRLCPELLILPGHMKKYKQASSEVRAICHEYTDLIEPLSVDEAFLDVTACTDHQGSATYIAEAIRKKITERTQLTASAGVAPNKFLAKIASDWKKPDGLFVITPVQISGFIKQLPVNKIFGVGKVTANKLKQLHVSNCGELQRIPEQRLINHFGRYGKRLYQLCRGIDDRPVETSRIRKSVSVENTFMHDLFNETDCMLELNDLYQKLLRRLQKHHDTKIHKQFIKLKFSDFQSTSTECISHTLSLHVFKLLLRRALTRQKKGIRLIGLGVRFSDDQNALEHKQLSLVL